MKFNLPAKCEIIFFDVVDQIILKIFKQKKSTIINLRLLRKDLNFFIFFKIFMSLKLIKILFKEGFLISYVASYIRYCESKRVITCVDNNIRFYRLKHYFRNIKFISIQNGLRHKFMDIFGNPNLDNNLKCDEILVFGNSIKKKYLNYIDAKIKTVGCFRNNNYKVFKLKKKKTVLFISQFRNFPHNKMMEHFGKKIITWGEMNSNLSFLLPNILSYCKKKNLKFGILSTTGSLTEYNFYKKILGKNIFWKFYKPKSKHESYKLMDMSEIIVNVWSTMGLESLSRGNKTCFFRQQDFGFKDRNFCWPNKYVNHELFYTDRSDYRTVSKILDNMCSINLENWRKIVNKYSKDNLIYDFQNKKLINLVKD